MLDPAIREPARTGKNTGTVGVTVRSGPITGPVTWVDTDHDHLTFDTEVLRSTFRALDANSRVPMSVRRSDCDTEARGRVAEAITRDAARAHVDVPARRHTGHDDTMPLESERAIVEVAHDRQRTRNV